MLERVLYLGYHLKRLDRTAFARYFAYARARTRLPAAVLMADVVASTLRYKISLLEYFQFGFQHLDHAQRARWAGTGYMYEYQLLMNPRQHRACLDNKLEFVRAYSPFVHRLSAGLAALRADPSQAEALLASPTGRVVLKYTRGQCGWQVQVVETTRLTPAELIARMESAGLDMAEEYIVQHHALMALSPTGVNTVRVITQLDADDAVQFLGARLRVSQGSHVDNLASGNFAAPIDLDSGVVSGPGVYGDPSREPVEVHPLTGTRVVGLQVPFWDQVLDLARRAALHHPENRSIGWDVAITEGGPELIEGNHDWCKLVWQLPVKTGLKPVLEEYARAYRARLAHGRT